MKPEQVPEKPKAAKLRAERMKSGTRPNPSPFCLPMGIPVNNFLVEVVILSCSNSCSAPVSLGESICNLLKDQYLRR
jgi:hypothetical protein